MKRQYRTLILSFLCLFALQAEATYTDTTLVGTVSMEQVFNNFDSIPLIELNKKYFSELTADTDLHAGGIFFCIIYRKCLLFLGNGEVQLSKVLVDPFRPMDDVDVSLIQNYHQKGRYFLNDRKYLECHFEEIDLTLTGLPTKKNPAIIAFHAFNKRLQQTWSEVFILDNPVVAK